MAAALHLDLDWLGWTSQLPCFWENLLQCICLFKAHFKIAFTDYMSLSFCTFIQLYVEHIKLCNNSIVSTLLAYIIHCWSHERNNCIHETSVVFILFGQGQTHKYILCTHVYTHRERERQRQTGRQTSLLVCGKKGKSRTSGRSWVKLLHCTVGGKCLREKWILLYETLAVLSSELHTSNNRHSGHKMCYQGHFIQRKQQNKTTGELKFS